MSAEPEPAGRRLFFREAIARAVADEMARDDRLVVMGQDVGRFGGAYKEFVGLHGRFGSGRVRDMPVSENAMIGVGVGAAAAGTRTLVSVTYMDFLMLGLDPLVNYAAKLRYKTGGQLRAPVVVKTTAGAKGQGVAHSQCIEAWLMGVPGLRVVAASTPGDAYGLLRSALQADGPVVFVDHKRLFPLSGMVVFGELVAIGQASIRRRGDDVTVTTHGYMTRIALEAADRLSPEGVSCEVIDLRSLSPLDMTTICGSVGRTGALVTLEEGQPTCGVGAEVAMRVLEELGSVPVARLGALPAPVSSNPVLESACLPDVDRTVHVIRNLLAERCTRR